MPAFLIALVITAILAIGIKESARFNSTIVVIKVSVVLFVIGLGFRYVSASNWGGDWHSFAPMGFSGIGAGAAYIFFAYIGFDAVSTTAQGSQEPAARFADWNHCFSGGLHCALYSRRGGSDRDGAVAGSEHRSPIARAFLDRGLTGASHIITLGALAGLTSVMLVMLLGQTRVLYSMANDGLLPKKFFADIHPPGALRGRTPFWWDFSRRSWEAWCQSTTLGKW